MYLFSNKHLKKCDNIILFIVFICLIFSRLKVGNNCIEVKSVHMCS